MSSALRYLLDTDMCIYLLRGCSILRTAGALVILLLAWSALARATPGRVALVIGNAAYKVQPLANPVNDATDMAATLRRLGFDVVHHIAC